MLPLQRHIVVHLYIVYHTCMYVSVISFRSVLFLMFCFLPLCLLFVFFHNDPMYEIHFDLRQQKRKKEKETNRTDSIGRTKKRLAYQCTMTLTMKIRYVCYDAMYVCMCCMCAILFDCFHV